MPNVKSILNDIEKLPLHQKEQILSTLEEILVLGSQVSQVEQEVKNLDFLRRKYAQFVALKLYQEMVSIMVKVLKVQNLLICQDVLVKEANIRKDYIIFNILTLYVVI
jgi:hypothetical protein